MGDNVERAIEEILKSNVIISDSVKEAMTLVRVYKAIDDQSRRSAGLLDCEISMLRGIIVFRLEQIYNEMEAASPYVRKRKLAEREMLQSNSV